MIPNIKSKSTVKREMIPSESITSLKSSNDFEKDWEKSLSLDDAKQFMHKRIDHWKWKDK